jgi:O-antigen biosynthesis protein WbqP
MTRLADLVMSSAGLLFLSPLLCILYVAGYLDSRAPLFRQIRVGRHQKPFVLVKFRTMRLDTAHMASHLADAAAITNWGRFLRRTKLDELPQLWNVLKGEMSLVGPRPCLFSQGELIAERNAFNVFDVRPGITGLAQINRIDMSTPRLLAETDARMLRDMSLRAYFNYIFQTLRGAGRGDCVKKIER